MPRRKRDLQFYESAYMNNRTYLQYYNRLTELAISMFEWKNLPDTIDPRFLELALFGDGMAAEYLKKEQHMQPMVITNVWTKTTALLFSIICYTLTQC